MSNQVITDLAQLPWTTDSWTIVCADKVRVDRVDYAIELCDKNGRVPVLVAAPSTLMLGPGSTITHASILSPWRKRRLRCLVRHGESAGLSLVEESIRIAELGPAAAQRGKSITVTGAQFDEALIVRNGELFRSALQSGIGPAKAYGFGLLSVKPTT